MIQESGMTTKNNSSKTCLIDTGHGWQVLVALVVVTVLYSLLAEAMVQIMPSFPLSSAQARDGSLILSSILLAVSVIALVTNREKLAATAVYIFTAVVTLYLFSGVILLLVSMPNLRGNEGGLVLLRDAIIVWVINVILFAVWYWLLDGGGPIKRCIAAPDRKDFLFPQEFMEISNWEGWRPGFFSYIFLSFHFCSTFGPSDAYVLSWRGKFLVMIQVAISLITLTMLIARAFMMIV